jgi:hypothetical protein
MESDSSASGSLDSACSAEELERELARLQAELEEYQDLIEQLPGIYESKFNHRVRDVAQEIRRLLDEREALQQQISRCLEAPPPPAALLRAAPEPELSRWQWSLPRLRRRLHWRPRWRLRSIRWRPEPWQLGLAAAATAVTAALVVNTALRPSFQQPRGGASAPVQPVEGAAIPPSSVTQPSDLPLRLRAQGEAWLEVQDLAGKVVYVNTLQAGDEQQVRLGQGLRVRSGRPDLLEVALAGEPFTTLGPVYDLSWRTFLPPDAPSPAAP